MVKISSRIPQNTEFVRNDQVNIRQIVEHSAYTEFHTKMTIPVIINVVEGWCAALRLKFLPVVRNMMNMVVNNYEVDSTVGSRDMGNQTIFLSLI